jgi:hypothetical protein
LITVILSVSHDIASVNLQPTGTGSARTIPVKENDITRHDDNGDEC